MSDYISREAVRKIESDSTVYAEAWNASYEQGFCDGINAVLEIPAADVVEVKHGEWIGRSENDPAPFCSVCGRTRFGSSLEYCKKYVPFCQYCGARMDGGDVAE